MSGEYHCPRCSNSLASAADPHLCELDLLVGTETLRVLFSRVAGELATFVVDNGQLKESYGKDSHRFDLHWGQTKYLV